MVYVCSSAAPGTTQTALVASDRATTGKPISRSYDKASRQESRSSRVRSGTRVSPWVNRDRWQRPRRVTGNGTEPADWTTSWIPEGGGRIPEGGGRIPVAGRSGATWKCRKLLALEPYMALPARDSQLISQLIDARCRQHVSAAAASLVQPRHVRRLAVTDGKGSLKLKFGWRQCKAVRTEACLRETSREEREGAFPHLCCDLLPLLSIPLPLVPDSEDTGSALQWELLSEV
ncbi:hypothetical protein EYF80_012465 [Liparis tanakae]|uniref:Uncharacterized protein n=1 Tax=Liparis tanakae TaxID=230148 RepID=A0A4Z2IHZ6_9TELE|nr:hypothetical protein EYF80_012465 [Liparis tanakae]